MVGQGGAWLERSIVDRMVGAPERLVFEGAPILVPPVAQDAEARLSVATEGEALDTIAACPPLTIVEKTKFARLLAIDKHRLAPESAKERDRFVEDQTDKIVVRTGCSQTAARATILNWIEGVLLPDVVLPFDDEEFAGSTVADVLADPERFAGETLADPLEGVDYGRCKAKIMRRPDGWPWINSFAHGRTVYELKYDASTIKAIIEESAEEAVAARFVELVAHAQLTEAELDTLKDLVALRAGCGKRPINKMVKDALTQEQIKQRNERRERRIAENTDSRQWMTAPDSEAPWLPQVDVINEVLTTQEEPLFPHIREPDGTFSLSDLAAAPGTHAFQGGN